MQKYAIKKKLGIFPVEEVYEEKVQRIEDEFEGKVPTFMGKFSLANNILDFDRDVLLGGYSRGDCHVISAFPNNGKTGMAVQQAALQAYKGFHVLYVSLEQTDVEIIEKALGIVGGKPSNEYTKIKYQNENEFKANKRNAHRMLKAYFSGRLHIVNKRMNVDEAIAFFKEVNEAKLFDICYVDNIQNISAVRGAKEEFLRQVERLTYEVMETVRDNAYTAHIWLSQLSSTGEYKNVRNAKPKNCTKINDDAVTFITLHREMMNDNKKKREEEFDPTPKSFINVTKNRKGQDNINFINGAFLFDTKKGCMGSFYIENLEDREEKVFGEVQDQEEMKEKGYTQATEDLFAADIFQSPKIEETNVDDLFAQFGFTN